MFNMGGLHVHMYTLMWEHGGLVVYEIYRLSKFKSPIRYISRAHAQCDMYLKPRLWV